MPEDFEVKAKTVSGTKKEQEELNKLLGDRGLFPLALKEQHANKFASADDIFQPVVIDDRNRLPVRIDDPVKVEPHEVSSSESFTVQVKGEALDVLKEVASAVSVEGEERKLAEVPFVPQGALYRQNPYKVTDGYVGALRMDEHRSLHTVIRSGENEAKVNEDGELSVSIDKPLKVQPHEVSSAEKFHVQETGESAGFLRILKDAVRAVAQVINPDDVGIPSLFVNEDKAYEVPQLKGGRVQVTALLDTPLPEGNNTVGKLAENDGVDIGDVDVTSIRPGTGEDNLGKKSGGKVEGKATGVLMLGTSEVSGEKVFLPQTLTKEGHQVVEGNVQDGKMDTGAPVKTGGIGPDGNRISAAFDGHGRQVVTLSQRELTVDNYVELSGPYKETVLLDADTDGAFLDIVTLLITKSDDTPVTLEFRDDMSGTIRFKLHLTTSILTPLALPIKQRLGGKPWTVLISSEDKSAQASIFVQAIKNT